jgi:general secretion pathway protein I
MNRAGFTLLEVLVAIAILGLGLTVILSSQVGLFSSANRAENLNVATNLARCRMSELEVSLMKDGYPLIDRDDQGLCCEQSEDRRFTCEWKILRVKLPELPMTDAADGGVPSDTDSLGPLGVLAEAQRTQGDSFGQAPDLGSLAESMTSAGTQGLAGMLFGMVYPDLKPMLEASIRKVVVSVKWKEGGAERDLSITQYVTDPQQGELSPDAGAQP